MSSALRPMIPVALPGALPCRAVLQMDLPVGTGRICSCTGALASPDDRARIGSALL